MKRALPVSLLIMMTLFAASRGVFATDVADYAQRVERARTGLGILLENISRKEIGEPPVEPDAAVLDEVARLIPSTEKVETPAGMVETNNQWFAEGLKATEAETNLERRAALLSELEMRLGSISAEINKATALAPAERSKDENKRQLAEILSRPEYQRPPEPQDDQKSTWLKRFLEWLERLFPKFSPREGSTEGISSAYGVLQWVLILAVIFVLGFVLYKLFPLFGPRVRGALLEENEARVILGERVEENRSSNDLFGEAEQLARAGDVRGAIRKGYIALLCELSDRDLIGLARHKTNRDYLRDVRKRRDVYERMSGLTGEFERHWYGSQAARPDDWEKFRRGCGETIKTI